MNQGSSAPWFTLPPTPKQDRIAIIGGGIAGCAVAHSLARRGRQVALYERQANLAQATSGNPLGVILPVVPRKPDPMGHYFKAAYRWILQKVKAFEAQGQEVGWRPTGVVHILAKERLRLLHDALTRGLVPHDQAVPIDAEEAARITGMPFTQPAIFYPDGGFLVPARLCQAYTGDAFIQIRRDWAITSIERVDGHWLLHTQQTSEPADVVVLANGCDAFDFPQVGDLPMGRSRGQLALLEAPLLAHVPRCVVCHKGYMVPGLNGDVLLGATWRKHHKTELQQDDQLELIEEARTWIPGFSLTGNPPLRGRVGFRARTPDHLPIVGPLPDQAAYRQVYGEIRHGKGREQLPTAPYLPGLFASLGHGGRGIVSTGLAGEVIAAQICGEVSPLETSILDSIHPGRFLIRALKKGRQ